MSGGLRMAVFFFLAGLVVLMWGATFVTKRHERVASGVADLPPRSFEALSLVVLGSGGSFENHLRWGPALAVAHGESALLLDAGRGVAEALRAAEFPAWQPRHVFLSSLQPENTVGLDDLWLTARQYPRPRAQAPNLQPARRRAHCGGRAAASRHGGGGRAGLSH